MTQLASIPDVVDVYTAGPAATDAAAPFDLLIEIPHGATRSVDYTRLAAELTSPLPANLADFFHVNTDAGAPELGLAIADALAVHGISTCVLRCRIPRTFIDCNRRMDASPEDFRAGKVTPGLMPWITSPEDRARLRGLYDQYVATTHAAVAELHAQRGAILALHTYAPREVAVEVDADIVRNLRAAYEPEKFSTWPVRPELDCISRGADGTDHAPHVVVDPLRVALAADGFKLADSATYPLHPSTLAWDHVVARPGRAVCIEVRRDLLAAPFDPFAEMHIGAVQVARLVTPFVAALRHWW